MINNEKIKEEMLENIWDLLKITLEMSAENVRILKNLYLNLKNIQIYQSTYDLFTQIGQSIQEPLRRVGEQRIKPAYSHWTPFNSSLLKYYKIYLA